MADKKYDNSDLHDLEPANGAFACDPKVWKRLKTQRRQAARRDGESPMVGSEQLTERILRILERAKGDKGEPRAFMTGFQILEGLPKKMRDALGPYGADIGKRRGAAAAIWDAIGRHPAVKTAWLRTRGITIGGRKPGSPICRIYRLGSTQQYGPVP